MVMAWRTINGNKVWIESRSTGFTHESLRQEPEKHTQPKFFTPAELAARRGISETSQKIRNETKREMLRLQNRKIELQKEHVKNTARVLFRNSLAAVSIYDPYLAGVYISYRFAEYSYDFIKKVKEAYDEKGNVHDAILAVVDNELRKKISLYLKAKMVLRPAEIITEHLYDKYRKTNYFGYRQELEGIIKQSMVESISYIIERRASAEKISNTEFNQIIMKYYFSGLLQNYAQKNGIDHTVIGLEAAGGQLATEFMPKFSQDVIMSNSFLNNEVDGKEWMKENLPSFLELV